MYTLPSLGLSSPPIMLKKVLLPDPLGPMIEMYSPRLMVTVTPLSAFTSVSPILYERFTSIVRTVYSESAVADAAGDGAGAAAAVSDIPSDSNGASRRARARGALAAWRIPLTAGSHCRL